MNIIFGLCGQGSRFKNAGYTIPKYLIAYGGAPMIYHSVATLKIPGKIHFVVKEEHLLQYKFLEKMLMSLGDEIIPCKNDTGGAAETLLLAKNCINQDEPLISANCDQYMNWNSKPFLKLLADNPNASYIPTFKETDPKCSFVRTDENFKVLEVREKKPISNDATVGIYHWCKAKLFFEGAEKMIKENNKENGEYYVAPVYNYNIKDGNDVYKYEIQKDEFWPVGTPKDLVRWWNHSKAFD